MNKEITNKTWCAIMRGGYKTFLTEAEAKYALEQYERGKTQIIFKKETKMIPMEGTIIIRASDVDREERIRRGEWKCKKGFWHSRNQQCGHEIIPQ